MSGVRQSFVTGKNTVDVARELLGCILVFTDFLSGKVRCSGRIVETEAYLADDPASHSFNGPTKRNEAMFLEAGFIYVYRIYGVHNCVNIVTGSAGSGEAVLLRALEPLSGMEYMWQNRFNIPCPENPPKEKVRRLASGPGNLCRAMGITVEGCNKTFLGGDGGADGTPHRTPESLQGGTPDSIGTEDCAGTPTHPPDRSLTPHSNPSGSFSISATPQNPGPLSLYKPEEGGSFNIVCGTRIGLAPGKGDKENLRFGIKNSPFLSRSFPNV